MNVNGVQGYSAYDAYAAYSKAKPADASNEGAAASGISEEAAVYEKSPEAIEAEKKSADDKVSTKKTYTPNAALVEQMKADQQALQQQLMSYVQESLLGQGNTLATSDDMWKFLASGNYTVTAEAKAEAQKAIADDGIWGVEQTSNRIVEFAKALTGGDPSKIEEMRSAINKGFKEATKTWGKELPEITSKTYDAIMEKLDKWAAESQAITE